MEDINNPTWTCDCCGEKVILEMIVELEYISVCKDCIQYAYDSVGYPKRKEEE